MQEQVVLRAATDADADRLADFLNTCTLAYQAVARSSPAEARAQLYDDGTDPAVDTRLALVQDEIVGFARVWAASDEELRIYARTHPAATGTGIGSALLAFCEGRARELAPERPRKLTTTNWAADERAPELLTGFGFAPVRYFLQMRIASDEILSVPNGLTGSTSSRSPREESRTTRSTVRGERRSRATGVTPTREPRGSGRSAESRTATSFPSTRRCGSSLWAWVRSPAFPSARRTACAAGSPRSASSTHIVAGVSASRCSRTASTSCGVAVRPRSSSMWTARTSRARSVSTRRQV